MCHRAEASELRVVIVIPIFNWATWGKRSRDWKLRGIRRLRFGISRLSRWSLLPWFLWATVILPSLFVLVRNRNYSADTWIDQFLVSGISVVMATFVAWVIWDRSRSIRARQEEKAAQKARIQLFLQAHGILYNVMGYIREKLVGHFAPFDKAYKADVGEVASIRGFDISGKPTFKNRIASLEPQVLSQRIQAFHRDVSPLMNQLYSLRALAYNSAVTLRLDRFLADWDAFVRDFGHFESNELYVREHEILTPTVEEHRAYVIGMTDLIYQQAARLAQILEGASAESSKYR